MSNNTHDVLAANFLVAQQKLAYARLTPTLEIESFSDNFAPIINSDDDNVIGRPITEVMMEFVGAEEMLQNVLNGRVDQYRLSNVIRENNGDQPNYLTFSTFPAEKDNPEAGLFILAQDTTTRGRLEQALVQERNELRLAKEALSKANDTLRRLDNHKSMLLSMAAHDLRTPLGVILGYTSLLDMMAGNEEMVKNYAELIGAQTHWLSRLIDDLLDLDAIERGELRVDREPFILYDVLINSAEAVRPLFRTKEIELHIEQDERTIFVNGDFMRMQQVLFNLLSNARKYTNPGGHVWLRAVKDGDHVVISVQDTGLGMTEDDLRRLFSPYFRTERVKNSKIVGVGLGLFIAKTLIERHDGEISVSSVVDEGSTFTIRLPAFQG